MIEGLPIGVAREELVTIDESQQRHGLAPQRVDDMTIIDDMAVLAFGVGAAARERHEMRAADKQVEPVITQTHAQPMADEAGGNGVEDLAQREAARRGDSDDRLL